MRRGERRVNRTDGEREELRRRQIKVRKEERRGC